MPTANDDEIGVLQDHSVVVTFDKLLVNDTGSDGTTLTIVDVSATSTNGGTIAITGNEVSFTPTTGFNGLDLFTYTLSDGCNSVSGSVFVSVLSAATPSANRIGDLRLDTDGAHVRFAAIPGFNYSVERSTTNTIWTSVGSVIAGPDGMIEFLDQNPPSGAVYYRTTTP